MSVTTSGSCSPARQRAQEVLPPGAVAALARQYGAGADLTDLATITGRSQDVLIRSIADAGTRVRGVHDPGEAEYALRTLDPVVLASVVHGHRGVAADGRVSGRGGARPSLAGRLRRLVRHHLHRLLADAGAVDGAGRAEAVLRLLIVAPADLDIHATRVLTDAALAAAGCAPDIGAGVMGWVAHLHGVAGRYPEALGHSDTALALLALADASSGGRSADPHADLHARWCRAGLLASAGMHAEAVRWHTDLEPLLRQAAASTGDHGPDRWRGRLLLARHHAALAGQALAPPSTGEHAGAFPPWQAADHLNTALTLFDEVLDDDGARDTVDLDAAAYERTLALAALGYAHHPRHPATARELWRIAAHRLRRRHIADPRRIQRAYLLVEQLTAAVDGAVLPPAAPDGILPLPRIPVALVDPALLTDDLLRSAPTAPRRELPDLPALH